MAAITMKNIVKKYGDGFPAVNDVSLDIADGEFMILVGPSGCGKSTLLRMIVGLEDITSGDMIIGGKRVNEKAPRDRNLAMVFQNYALYPHLTVFENIAFPLRLAKAPAEERDPRARSRRPPTPWSSPSTSTASRPTSPAASASGWPWAGPSSARPTRSCSTSRCPTSTPSSAGRCAPRSPRMQRRLGITTVYVTHDQTEAMTLGDRVAVLRKGESCSRSAQPRELYEHPPNLFVAGFIGSPPMNFVPGRVHDTTITTPFGDTPADTERLNGCAGHELVILGIRPQHFEDATLIEETTRPRGQTFPATIDVTEWLGDELYAYVPYEAPQDVTNQLKELQRELDSEQMRTQLVVSLNAESRIRGGTTTDLWFDAEQAHLFNPATGENLTHYPTTPHDTTT